MHLGNSAPVLGCLCLLGASRNPDCSAVHCRIQSLDCLYVQTGDKFPASGFVELQCNALQVPQVVLNP